VPKNNSTFYNFII